MSGYNNSTATSGSEEGQNETAARNAHARTAARPPQRTKVMLLNAANLNEVHKVMRLKHVSRWKETLRLHHVLQILSLIPFCGKFAC